MILFPGDRGWWKAWRSNPFNWVIVGLFAVLYLMERL